MTKTKEQALSVLELLREAASAMRALENESAKMRDWGAAGSFKEYASRLEEVISCDNGESGFAQLVKVLK